MEWITISFHARTSITELQFYTMQMHVKHLDQSPKGNPNSYFSSLVHRNFPQSMSIR